MIDVAEIIKSRQTRKPTDIPLDHGDHLSTEEFLRRWNQMPNLKNAELIGGKVYMPSPVSVEHSDYHSAAFDWVSGYARGLAACHRGDNATLKFSDNDAPQPDVFLRLKSEYGGNSRTVGKFIHGAPELIVEICYSSAAYDLFEKKALYAKAGVREYVAVLLIEQKVKWMLLEGGKYKLLQPSRDGLIRSSVFPGLWLDPVALLNNDTQRLLDVVALGKKSPEFSKFAARKPQHSSK